MAAAIATLLTMAALWNLWRQSSKRGSFYLCTIILLPAILLAIGPREDIYPRYFLVSVMFLLMLWADFLGDIGRRSSHGKLWLTVVLAVFTLANGWHVAELIRWQCSHYEAVLETLDKQSRGEEIRVVVNHPDRQNMMLDFYSQRANLHKPIKVAVASAEEAETAEWILVHHPNLEFTPLPMIELHGVKFELVEHYPFAGLSGWQLCLYQRERL